MRVVHTKSPLSYRSGPALRLALVDSDVEADERDRYFNEPGLVAFLDYHREPNSRWADGNDYIYLDYANVRPSHRKKGLGKRLFNEMLRKYGKDTLYGFGKIMSPAIYRMYRQWQRRGLNVTGKNYDGYTDEEVGFTRMVRRVARRHTAGLFKAPPEMVKEITEWAVKTIAEKLLADLAEELEWLEEEYSEALKAGDRKEAAYNREQIEDYTKVEAVLRRYARTPKAHSGKVTKKFNLNLSGWPYKADERNLPDLPVTVVLANKDWKHGYYSKAIYDFDNMKMAINASLIGFDDPGKLEAALKAIPKAVRHELQHYAQDIMSIGLPEGAKPGLPKPRVRDHGVGTFGPYSLDDKEYHPLLTDEVESFVEAAQGLPRRDLNQAVKDWTAGRSRLPGYDRVNKRFWSELSQNRGKYQEAIKTFYKEVMDELTPPRRVASSGHLNAEEFVGHRGYKGHMTRWEQGEIPTSEALKISPPKGYHGRRKWQVKGGERYFGSYREDDWNEFLDDVRRNGIKSRLWIQVDPGEEAQIMEGNHRVQAAVQLGLATVPVTIKYYGLREEDGLVAPRVRRTITHQDDERKG